MIASGNLRAEFAKVSPEKLSTRRFAFINLESSPSRSPCSSRLGIRASSGRSPRSPNHARSPRSPSIWAVEAVEKILSDSPKSRAIVSKELFNPHPQPAKMVDDVGPSLTRPDGSGDLPKPIDKVSWCACGGLVRGMLSAGRRQNQLASRWRGLFSQVKSSRTIPEFRT